MRKLLLSLAVPALFSIACSSTTEDTDATNDELNYRSTAGQEYLLSTTVTFKPADGADQDAIAKQAEQVRTTVITTIVSQLDTLWPEDFRTTGAGVAIQYRQQTAALADLKPVDGGLYSMTVSGEFAAVKGIEQKLPLQTVDGKSFYPVTVDVGTGPENLQVTLTPEARSLNAYPKYLDLFADGLDVSVHFGGDHDDPPQDINHARSMYDDLIASGFKSPVNKFEDLKIDSGPLTSSITVKGTKVPVRVSIFHVDMSTPDTRQLLVDAYKKSMHDADVVVYDGHAGRQLDWSGVVLAYKPARVSITAADFKNIETGDKQQLYLFNGCETYTGYADKLYENPKRNVDNTDVITTGNFSAIQPKANQVIGFLHQLIDQKNGAWVPHSWDSVLGKMNAIGERSWVHVYGVHGIDDDPKVSPLADPAKIGAACAADADCGAADSRCLAVDSSHKVCGAACADDSGCPNGLKCVLPIGKKTVDDFQCSPK